MSQNANNKKQQKRKYNLGPSPLSSAEKKATDSVLNRLLGTDNEIDHINLDIPKKDLIDLKADLKQNDHLHNRIQIDKKSSDLTTTISPNNPVIEAPGDSNPVTTSPSDTNTPILEHPVTQTPGHIITRLFDNREKGFFIPNWIEDELMPTLEISEQVVLRRIIRLTIGFHRSITDPVGSLKLAEKCNMSESGVKKAIRSLEQKRMIAVHRDFSGNRYTGGNKYEILFQNEQKTPGYEITPLASNSIKDDDHDDLKRQDHHQTVMSNISDHKKAVMMTYQEITGNLWSKADHTNYEKIKHIPIEKIEVALRLANDRATNRPNSFAFFIKEILGSVNVKPQSRATRKKVMQKIVERVRNASVGSNISPSEFVHKVKEACLREDAAFDNDLFNEVIGKLL
ncbi:MAG: hypothetical protein WAQ98_22800 [Blastocatellia bacterium]